MNGHGTNKPSAFGCSRHADFAAKLIPFMRFAFADAFDFRGMNTVHFVFIMALLAEDQSADSKQSIQLVIRLEVFCGLVWMIHTALYIHPCTAEFKKYRKVMQSETVL